MILVYSLALIWLTWLLYVAVMALKRCRDAGLLTIPMKVLGYPILFIGLFCDFLLNMTVCSALFVEVPHEWLVTARLKRHAREATWRGSIARWIAYSLLDSLDPSGKHV